MKKVYLILIGIISLITYNCATDSISDLEDVLPINTTITYDENVAPIMNNNCIECHSNPPQNGAPIPLTTFEEVRTSTQNNLIDRISRSTGAPGAMPLGASRLPQGLIDQVIQWETDGFLEN